MAVSYDAFHGIKAKLLLGGIWKVINSNSISQTYDP